jgi:gamma-glutamyltranspeptidase
VTEIDGIFGSFGHAHVIEVTDDGLAGAADPRALISAAAGY